MYFPAAADNAVTANAIRDYNYILGFEGLAEDQEKEQRELLVEYFHDIAPDIYNTGYRGILEAPAYDPLRNFLWKQTWLAKLFGHQDSKLHSKYKSEYKSELLSELQSRFTREDLTANPYLSSDSREFLSEMESYVRYKNNDDLVHRLEELADNFDQEAGDDNRVGRNREAEFLRTKAKELKANEVEATRIRPKALPGPYLRFVDKIARFVIAFAGSVSLIVPMLIMSFNRSRTNCLATASASVVLFGLFFSFGTRASDKATLAAVTTYTAVLVVLVSISLPSA